MQWCLWTLLKLFVVSLLTKGALVNHSQQTKIYTNVWVVFDLTVKWKKNPFIYVVSIRIFHHPLLKSAKEQHLNHLAFKTLDAQPACNCSSPCSVVFSLTHAWRDLWIFAFVAQWTLLKSTKTNCLAVCVLLTAEYRAAASLHAVNWGCKEFSKVFRVSFMTCASRKTKHNSNVLDDWVSELLSGIRPANSLQH